MRFSLRSLFSRPDSLYERNARNVMVDGVGVGLVTGVATFLSVFLIRLGASNLQVGLLTAMPAVVGALVALPVGEFLQRRTNLIAWYARSRLWVLSSYALTGIVPFFIVRGTPEAIVLIWAIAALPQVMVNVAFTLVMSAVAGPQKRIELMSRRWTTLGITNAVSVAVAGLVLNRIGFPLNYQWVFIASFVGGLISYIFSTSIVLPPNEAPPSKPSHHWWSVWREMGTTLRRNRRFAQFILSQFVFRFGMTMVLPLLPLYWVKVAQANDAQIGLINTVGSGVLLIAYSIWVVLSQRRGERFVLLLCCGGLALYPLLVAMTRNLYLLPIYAGFAGIFAAGIDLVLFDFLIATCPPDQRGQAIGLSHTTVYFATFAAPLIGTAAAEYVGIGTMLMVAAAIRLAGLLLFALLHVGTESNEEQQATNGVQRAKGT